MKYDEVQAVQIHLAPAARREARKALYRAGTLGFWAALDYPGPHFKSNTTDTISYAIGHSTLNVLVTPGDPNAHASEYIFPLATVGRIRITTY